MVKISTIQTIVNGAEKTTAKLDDWAQKADKIVKSGGTLNEFQTIIKDIKGFGQLSSVLGFIGAGLSVIAFFLPEKSEQEIIIEKLDNLQESVDRLGDHIDNRFKELKEKLELETGKGQLNRAITEMEDIKKIVRNLLDAKKNNEPHDHFEDELLRRTFPLTEVTTQIKENCTGTPVQDNVLGKTYDYQYGNLSQMFAISHFLLGYALLAPIYDSIISTLRLKKKKTKLTEKDVEDLHQQISKDYHTDIIAITKAINKWNNQCITELSTNVTNVVEKVLTNLMVKDYSYYQSNSQVAVQFLQANYPQYNWSVIVYEPVVGTVEHAYSAHNIQENMGCKHFFRLGLRTGGDINFIVYWYPRTTAEPYPPITLDEALNPGKNRRDRSLDKNSFYTYPPHRPQHAHVFYVINSQLASDDNRDLKKYVHAYSLEKDPEKAPSSLLWIFHDYYWEHRFGFTCHAPIYGLKSEGSSGYAYSCLCIYAGLEVLDT